MTVLQHHQNLCNSGSITFDAEQLAVLCMLQSIHDDLLREHAKRTSFTQYFRKKKLIPGLYLWGGVGIGKTMMLDCFYQALPFTEKMRLTFYQFMHLVHGELSRLQGKENPLALIAKNIAEKTLVLCFDEFIITDAVDALILKQLLQELFAQGVCIVTTSNKPPEEVCKTAWRENFLPAVNAIKQYMQVFHITSITDYRTNTVDKKQFYNSNNDATHQYMESIFTSVTNGNDVTEEALEVLSRKIPVRKRSQDVAWFDFATICSVPRSQQDYLVIAEKYKTIFISNIPKISSLADNAISLFIRLVDVFYDAKVRLIFSSADQIEQLYTQGQLSFEYARTCSRLLQMQAAFLPKQD